MENVKDTLLRIESNYKTALSEFTRQSGYVEGTLDTIISMMMDVSPEISLTSDRLIKTFHSIEGICQQGLTSEFEALLLLCKELLEENQKLKQPPITLDLDTAAKLLAKETKSKKAAHGS